jgi:hypothetical protein
MSRPVDFRGGRRRRRSYKDEGGVKTREGTMQQTHCIGDRCDSQQEEAEYPHGPLEPKSELAPLGDPKEQDAPHSR